MSYYRSVYLKSEHWFTLRIRRLALSKGLCAICSHRSLSNDVHHISYSTSLFEVDAKTDLRVVCRKCHSEIHRLIDENPAMKILTPADRWREAAISINRWRAEEEAESAFAHSRWFSLMVSAARSGYLPAMQTIIALMDRVVREARTYDKERRERLIISFLRRQDFIGRLAPEESPEVSFKISDSSLQQTHEFAHHGNFSTY